ncbi:MAG: EpsD family peptidyl-prolyl cis-trans isomerase [Steroidobacteraceae bacterium]
MRSEHIRGKLVSQVLAAVGVALLVGCSRGSDQHSQVVATVNDHELTVLQLSQALQGAGAEDNPQATRKALASLIDEELLVQQATKDQLDRDPALVQAMEQDRRHLLAQAYAQRNVYPKTTVSPDEMEEYYRAHPALFAQRRLYRLTVFAVRDTDMSNLLAADLDKARSEDDVRAALQRHEIKFETQPVSCAAEELPLDRVDDFAKARAGDLLIGGQTDGKTLLMSVVALEERPLSFEHAKPMITQYLTTVRNAQATDTYLKKLKEKAKIAYSPRYAAQLQGVSRSAAQSLPGAPSVRSGSSKSAVASARAAADSTGLN